MIWLDLVASEPQDSPVSTFLEPDSGEPVSGLGFLVCSCFGFFWQELS